MTPDGPGLAAPHAREPFRALEAGLPALAWVVDAEEGGRDFSHSWTLFAGAGEADLSAAGWLGLVHPDDRPALEFLSDPSLGTAACSLDIRIRDRAGRYRWFLVNCAGPGPCRARALVAVPIDARKRSETELERELSDARAILDNAPAMMWRTTASGEMDYANTRYLEAWGRTLDQVRGWGWKDSIHPDDRQGLIDYWQAHRFTDRDGMYEFRVGAPETGYRWCLSVCSPQLEYDGTVRRWLGATFDIEARKQAEDKLRRSEAFLRQGQRISMTGSVALDRSSGEHYWSEETYRILGLERSVVPGFEALLARVHREDAGQVAAAIERARRGECDVSLEFRAVMPDGRVKHLRLLVNPGHAGEDGANLSGVIMDITAAKLAEEEMHRAQADLTRITRIATMAELTASIAHEINQPISGVLTNSEACLRWIDRPEPDLAEAREAVERTVIGARRVSEVVRQLRAIFAREAPEPTRFNLADLVTGTLPLLRSHINQHRASVAVDLADPAHTILADQVQLQQVLINLVMNGLQAPGRTGTARRLVIATSSEADRAGLTVSDNGPGIAESDLATIFEPFFTTRADGMGMGLSICRSIVESHGGTIFARGNADGGATVGFLFPIADQAAAGAGGGRYTNV